MLARRNQLGACTVRIDDGIEESGAAFRCLLIARIAAFLEEIGLEVRPGAVAPQAVLPGIGVEHGGLVIDEERLRYPGDILHEAGHLAVVPPERRAAPHRDVGNDPAEEMMAIAWSYAAALHLRLDPAIVFHEDGYRGEAASLLANFQQGRYVGLPMLQWTGMAYSPGQAPSRPAFPHMLRWLRPS